MRKKLTTLVGALAISLMLSGVASASDTTHTVKKGETLSEIAEAYDLNLLELSKANELKNPNTIQVGEEITINGIEKSDSIYTGFFAVYMERNYVDTNTAPRVTKTPSKDRPRDSRATSNKDVNATYVVTAYTAGVESTGKTPNDPAYGLTASGKYVQDGRTLACPPSMPFGTRVTIPSLGTTYTCEDRGGHIKGNRLDVYMGDLTKAIEWGRRTVDVIIH